jgi:hypothetical protein
MQFKSKRGLVDIPNDEVLTAARDIYGDDWADLKRAIDREIRGFRNALADVERGAESESSVRQAEVGRIRQALDALQRIRDEAERPLPPGRSRSTG